MIEFRKIEESELDHRAVCLDLIRYQGQKQGRSLTPGNIDGRRPSRALVIPDDSWLPAEAAVQEAALRAAEYKTRVDVIDPENLWEVRWRVLHRPKPEH